MKKKSFYEALYEAVYKLFEECNYRLTLNVEGISLRLYDPEDDNLTDNVWNMGVVANGEVYKVGDLYCEGKGPGTYAKLFSGDYDIIDGLAEAIYADAWKLCR